MVSLNGKILTVYIILIFNISFLTLKYLYTYEYTIEISTHRHIVNINEVCLYILISNSLKIIVSVETCNHG